MDKRNGESTMKFVTPALIISSALLLSACGEEEHALNNWNCTDSQLTAYSSQVTDEVLLKFIASCEVKKLGEFSSDWKTIKTRCFFKGGKNCGDAERAALLDLWKKEAQ